MERPQAYTDEPNGPNGSPVGIQLMVRPKAQQ